MRPRRLEVEGFTAFRRPVTVDFEGADLFALVGPTGAGKTSVIDAITFALYGIVPRLDHRRAVAPVVSQNLTEARLRFDFTVGPTSYTAVRVVRATKTGATTKEARLQRGEEVLAGTADEVEATVTDLLGLSYEHFITCVSLPQGQFARFLHHKPRDRQDLLVRLLDLGLYDAVAGAARQRAGFAASRVEVLGGQLDRLAGATPEAREAAFVRLAELAALAERLDEARPEIEAATAAAATEREAIDRCRRHLGLLDRLEAPAGVDELSEAVAEAGRRRSESLAREEEATSARCAAEDRLSELPARARLEQRRVDLARREQLVRLVEKGRSAESDAVEAVRSGEARLVEAEAERDRQATDLERLQVEQRAHALVGELRVGEPCPVCRQAVTTLPELHAPDLAAARAALAEAGRRVESARQAVTDARTEHARVEEKLAQVEADLAELTERLDGGEGGEGGSSQVDEQLAEVLTAEQALVRAREVDRAARAERLAADRHHEQLVEREAAARREFDAARDAVAALEPPATDRRDLAADWRILVEWAERRRPSLAEEVEQHDRRAGEAEAAATARLDRLAEAGHELGVDVPVDAGDLARRAARTGEMVAAAHGRAEEALVRLEAELGEADRLRDEQRHATEHQRVAEALALHLTANRFEKWLLDEAVQRLVVGASSILGELTAGAYALSVDDRGAFTVLDHANASQPRPARTLSGGETFLASLALALALADQVAELAVGGVARLETLFLDEGFGTLDAETLDVVASALDELGSRGRMVGVVTHVRELAERLPVRFEVQKAGGVATVERVDA